MNNNLQNLTNSIANITTINNQTAIIVASTFSSAENSMTSLGGAIGIVQTTEDFNKLLNEAAKHSYENLHLQTPYFQGLAHFLITSKTSHNEMLILDCMDEVSFLSCDT